MRRARSFLSRSSVFGQPLIFRCSYLTNRRCDYPAGTAISTCRIGFFKKSCRNNLRLFPVRFNGFCRFLAGAKKHTVKGTLEGTNRAFESGWRPPRSNCTGNSPQNPVHDYSRNALNKQADVKEEASGMPDFCIIDERGGRHYGST